MEREGRCGGGERRGGADSGKEVASEAEHRYSPAPCGCGGAAGDAVVCDSPLEANVVDGRRFRFCYWAGPITKQQRRPKILIGSGRFVVRHQYVTVLQSNFTVPSKLLDIGFVVYLSNLLAIKQ